MQKISITTILLLSVMGTSFAQSRSLQKNSVLTGSEVRPSELNTAINKSPYMRAITLQHLRQVKPQIL